MQISNRRFVQVGLLIFATIALALSAQATTLQGTWSFQVNGSKLNTWSSTITCTDQNGNFYPFTAGGSETGELVYYGVISFGGNGTTGSVTGSLTTAGTFNQTASDATVVPVCPPGISNNGYAVYDEPVCCSSISGNYARVGDIGTINTGGSLFTNVTFELVPAAKSGFQKTMFMYVIGEQEPYKPIAVGTAVSSH